MRTETGINGSGERRPAFAPAPANEHSDAQAALIRNKLKLHRRIIDELDLAALERAEESELRKAVSQLVRTFAHEVALQIAAAAPLYISESDIPAEALAHEAEIAKNRAIEEGKPEAVAGKIVEGRLNKYKDEVCLLRQAYIRDEGSTIEEMLHQNVASLGENIVIRRFQRWELGEGLGE